VQNPAGRLLQIASRQRESTNDLYVLLRASPVSFRGQEDIRGRLERGRHGEAKKRRLVIRSSGGNDNEHTGNTSGASPRLEMTVAGYSRALPGL